MVRERNAAASWQSPVIVLVGPQMGENVGAAARAMLNCGLTELRLVSPRDGWPNDRAQAMATGASRDVIDRAQVFESTAAAVADLHRVYATTARRRDMLKPVIGPRELASEIRDDAAAGQRSGVLFGPERAGLDNDDVALASHIVHIPLNAGYSSLNLAQAVLLVAYAWFEAEYGAATLREQASATPPATSAQLVNLFEHLEQELDASGFLRVAEKRGIMVRNLRSILHRAELREHEVRALHGVVSSLSGRRKDGRLVRQPALAAGAVGEDGETDET
ncbi:MAG: RNA methyltransferase [Acidobacteriota bacterium]|nr:RNA methyltransferase [Acidobacteriota bacterium]MDE2924408.1 RNA methyltransferase [Acidobacteriota bacterium]MDE3264058.1 RNA methyltransferase [Acidobacteriota bacterium]